MQEILSQNNIWRNFNFNKENNSKHVRWKITFIRGQADGTNEICYRHAIIQSKQRHIIIEITVTKLLRYRSQYEACLGAHWVIATIVLTKRNLDHEPHEAFDLDTQWRRKKIMRLWRNEN